MEREKKLFNLNFEILLAELPDIQMTSRADSLSRASSRSSSKSRHKSRSRSRSKSSERILLENDQSYCNEECSGKILS